MFVRNGIHVVVFQSQIGFAVLLVPSMGAVGSASAFANHGIHTGSHLISVVAACLFAGQEFPAALVSRVVGLSTGGGDNGDVIAVFFAEGHDFSVEHFEVREEFVAPVFVAHAQILQVEGFGVTQSGTESAVFGGFVAVGKLNQVFEVLDVVIHQSAASCVGAVTSGLAKHTTGHNRQRFCAQVFRHLEIFQIAQAHGHGIAPNVVVFFPLFCGAYALLPVVYVIPGIAAFGDAAAGETKEGGVGVQQRLHQIFPQTVVGVSFVVRVSGLRAFLIGVAPGLHRHQGHHINVSIAGEFHHQSAQSIFLGIAGQNSFILSPFVTAHIDGLGVGELVAVVIFHIHQNGRTVALGVDGEIIGGAGFHIHGAAVGRGITLVGDPSSVCHSSIVVVDGGIDPGKGIVFLSRQSQSRVGFVQTAFALSSHAAVFIVPILQRHMSAAGSAGGVVGGVPAEGEKLEGAVLHQFRVDTAVGSVVDVLIEQAEQSIGYIHHHIVTVNVQHIGNRVGTVHGDVKFLGHGLIAVSQGGGHGDGGVFFHSPDGAVIAHHTRVAGSPGHIDQASQCSGRQGDVGAGSGLGQGQAFFGHVQHLIGGHAVCHDLYHFISSQAHIVEPHIGQIRIQFWVGRKPGVTDVVVGELGEHVVAPINQRIPGTGVGLVHRCIKGNLAVHINDNAHVLAVFARRIDFRHKGEGHMMPFIFCRADAGIGEVEFAGALTGYYTAILGDEEVILHSIRIGAGSVGTEVQDSSPVCISGCIDPGGEGKAGFG